MQFRVSAEQLRGDTGAGQIAIATPIQERGSPLLGHFARKMHRSAHVLVVEPRERGNVGEPEIERDTPITGSYGVSAETQQAMLEGHFHRAARRVEVQGRTQRERRASEELRL